MTIEPPEWRSGEPSEWYEVQEYDNKREAWVVVRQLRRRGAFSEATRLSQRTVGVRSRVVQCMIVSTND